jgi:hypothetical protein
VPREAEDADLVVRWPLGVPRNHRSLFVDDSLTDLVKGV